MGKLDKKKIVIADLSLIIVAAVWGGGFVAVKDALDNISPFYIMAMRFSIAAILLMAIYFKKFKQISRREMKAGIILGVLLFLAFAFQTVGLQYTTASKQSFLTAIYVVMVPFLSWMIFKKSPGIYNVIAALLCLVGIGLLTLQNGIALGAGDSLTLICALLFAAHIVTVGYFAKEFDPIVLTILQMIVSAVLSIVCAVIFENPPSVLGKEVIVPIIYLGLFSTLLAFLIQNVAQKYTYSTHAALIMCLEAVFGTILSVIILNEVISFKIIIGCVLIFISIIISETELKFLRKSGNEVQIQE